MPYTNDKSEQIHFRVSPMEKLELEAEAKKRNMTLSAFMLGAAFGVIACAFEAVTDTNARRPASKS